MSGKTRAQIQSELSEFFPADVLSWKPQSISGNRALAVAFVDARDVMDRLDAVLGIGNWQTSYRELPDGVVCKLRVRIEQEWVNHEDVGSFSEQPDAGDRLKAAYSDALKRVAVHLGISRYLYSLPTQWVDYDAQKRQFTRPPVVPAAFLPRTKAAVPHVNEDAAQMSDEAEVARIARLWGNWLEVVNDDIDVLNKGLPKLADVKNPRAKSKVKDTITAHARARDWEFDKETATYGRRVLIPVPA